MIYSVLLHKEVPVTVTKETQTIGDECDDILTRYTVYDVLDKSKEVGYLDLKDNENGVKVVYIKNEQPDLYRHFGQVADQIEVEHCMKRNIKKPYIHSVAAINTHILHYKRGKRFINEGLNIYLDNLMKNLQKGERVMTEFLGYQKMYMPIKMINELKDKIKVHPLIKGLK